MNLPFNSKSAWKMIVLAGGVVGLMVTLVLSGLPSGTVYAQQPTGSVATVTGTPTGPTITVYSDQLFIDVYTGPSSYDYDPIGVLASGEKAPAVGISQDGKWIKIVYLGVPGNTGWVYGPFVSISKGILPKLAPPPTAAPRTTPTLDPTYVVAYGLNLQPTQLPTFTAPAPLKLPTFTPNTTSVTKVPYGFVILALALIGILGAIISFLRGNR